MARDLRKVRETLAKEPFGRRRSTFETAPAADALPPPDAYIPREPITVILSERGWIRAAKGAVADPSELKFKEGDKLAFLVPAETPDKLMILASDGRFFTLGCDKLPSARGQGEPLRLMLDVDDHVKITAVFTHKPGRKRVMASSLGYGFLLDEAEALANRRAGKAVLNVGDDKEGGEARLCLPVEGDHLAVIGDNGKVLMFPARRPARDGPRQGRQTAELPRRRPARRPHLRRRHRPQLGGQRGPQARVEGLEGLARQTRQLGQAGPARVREHPALPAGVRGSPHLSAHPGECRDPDHKA